MIQAGFGLAGGAFGQVFAFGAEEFGCERERLAWRRVVLHFLQPVVQTVRFLGHAAFGGEFLARLAHTARVRLAELAEGVVKLPGNERLGALGFIGESRGALDEVRRAFAL